MKVNLTLVVGIKEMMVKEKCCEQIFPTTCSSMKYMKTMRRIIIHVDMLPVL